MKVLILKNITIEGPGTIEDFLKLNSISYTIVDLSLGETIPATEEYNCLVILGGPMSVNDRDKIDYLNQEIDIVKDFIEKRKKILGICLGAQIIAKSLGANVYKGTHKEIGWFKINFCQAAFKDKFMTSLAINSSTKILSESIEVFHLHGETFTLPQKSILLASSELYKNQAFKFNDNCYGFQFHIEVTEDIARTWLKNESLNPDKITFISDSRFQEYTIRAKQFYKSFFKS